MENTQLPKVKLRSAYDEDADMWKILANAYGNEEVEYGGDDNKRLLFVTEERAERYINKLTDKEHYLYERESNTNQ